jgi:ribosomal protein S18
MEFKILLTIITILLLTGICWKFKIVPFGMAMNFTKSNILAVPVEIFLAERTSETNPTTLPSLAEVNGGGSATWKYCGSAREGDTKVPTEEFSENLQDGQLKQTGIGIKVESNLTETDYAKIQLLESFIDKTVDILLREVGGSTVHRYQRMGITVGFEGLWTRKKANTIKLTAAREVGKLTEAYDKQTLV